ncbi:MAG: hypothetical protein PF961_14750 [Planctomycetota bacterium]|jgi:hypothetical protein|nr:hypothetical protein [Planctomycetota bacterium]
MRTCPHLLHAPALDQAGLNTVLSIGLPFTLQQAWPSAPEADLQAGHACISWTPAALYVAAQLSDTAIVNPERRFNERAFLAGDAFEIFLRSLPGESYIELHVTPHNTQFQLRIPSAEAFHDQPDADWRVHDSLFTSIATIQSEAWQVLAEIPAQALGRSAFAPADELQCCFARYDYEAEGAQPVLSASPAFTKLSFHRVHEWPVIRLA